MKSRRWWWMAVALVLGLSSTAAANRDGTLALVPAAELEAMTGGRCISKCPEDPEEPVYSLGTEWHVLKQSDGAAEQLAYSIFTEISNVYGSSKLPWDVTASDKCKYRWTSGGVGISTGFNVSIGTTYSCAATVRLSGTLDPGWRVKVYKGDMRQYSSVTMALYEHFSDGSVEDTGKRDTGRRERHWSRYSPVASYGY